MCRLDVQQKSAAWQAVPHAKHHFVTATTGQQSEREGLNLVGVQIGYGMT